MYVSKTPVPFFISILVTGNLRKNGRRNKEIQGCIGTLPKRNIPSPLASLLSAFPGYSAEDFSNT
jgi:hypothetical protein